MTSRLTVYIHWAVLILLILVWLLRVSCRLTGGLTSVYSLSLRILRLGLHIRVGVLFLHAAVMCRGRGGAVGGAILGGLSGAVVHWLWCVVIYGLRCVVIYGLRCVVIYWLWCVVIYGLLGIVGLLRSRSPI